MREEVVRRHAQRHATGLEVVDQQLFEALPEETSPKQAGTGRGVPEVFPAEGTELSLHLARIEPGGPKSPHQGARARARDSRRHEPFCLQDRKHPGVGEKAKES